MQKTRGNYMSEIRYMDDKPKDCRFCYWWGGKKAGCSLGEEDCYYKLPDETGKPKGRCDGCPYKKSVPCIGYCASDIVKEVLGK